MGQLCRRREHSHVSPQGTSLFRMDVCMADNVEQIAEAAVVAVKSVKWMERPMACVVLQKDAELSKEEIIEYITPKMAKVREDSSMISGLDVCFLAPISRACSGGSPIILSSSTPFQRHRLESLARSAFASSLSTLKSHKHSSCWLKDASSSQRRPLCNFN